MKTQFRDHFSAHADAVGRTIEHLDGPVASAAVALVERVRASGEMLTIQVVGLATIAADVSPELARETIGSIQVLGALHASSAVKAALADRTH